MVRQPSAGRLQVQNWRLGALLLLAALAGLAASADASDLIHRQVLLRGHDGRFSLPSSSASPLPSPKPSASGRGRVEAEGILDALSAKLQGSNGGATSGAASLRNSTATPTVSRAAGPLGNVTASRTPSHTPSRSPSNTHAWPANATHSRTPLANATATASPSPVIGGNFSASRTPTPAVSPSSISTVSSIFVAPGNGTCGPCGTGACPCPTIQEALDSIDKRQTGTVVVFLAPATYEGAGNQNISFPSDTRAIIELRSLVTAPSSSVATIACEEEWQTGLTVPENTAGGSYAVSSVNIEICGTASRIRTFALAAKPNSKVTLAAVSIEGKVLVAEGADMTVTESNLLGTADQVLSYTLSPIQVKPRGRLTLISTTVDGALVSSDFLEGLKAPVSVVEGAEGCFINMTDCNFERVSAVGRGILDRSILGVFVGSGLLHMVGCTFSNNTGGPAVMVVNSTAIITDCSFANHIKGSAIVSENSHLTMSGGSVDGASSLLSPAVFVYGEDNNPAVFDGVSFTRNRNALGDGGALHFASGNITLSGCTFGEFNYARRGGSIFFGASPLHSILQRFNEPRLMGEVELASVTGALVSHNDTDLDFFFDRVAQLEVEHAGALAAFGADDEAHRDRLAAGWLSVVNCHFVNSTARSSGGGIHALGDISVSISQCTFHASAISQGHGGAVFVQTSASTVTSINGTDFTSNSARRGSGGALASSGFTSMSKCVVHDNLAENGGGVFASDGEIMIEGADFRRNEGNSGGGGCFFGGGVAGEVMNTNFTSNIAFQGGAIKLADNASPSFSGVLCVSNNATNAGSAIITDGESWSAFTDLTVRSSFCDGSGTIVVTGESGPSFRDTVVTDNEASQEGGGIVVLEAAGPFFSNVNVTRNRCNTSGGGIVTAGNAQPSFENCLISNNAASSGGGVLCLGESVPTLRDCIVKGNFAFGDGGGLSVQDSGALVFSNGVIRNNTALSAGGGVSVHGDGKPRILDSEISLNTALSHGGGLSMHDRSQASVESCHIVDNESPVNGGGIVCLDLSNGTISWTVISGNSAGSQGGGVLVTTFAYPLFQECNITQNFAKSKGGGMQLVNNCRPTVRNCDISYNNATNGGGLALNDNSQPHLANLTIHNNIATSGGGGMLMEDSAGGTMTDSSVSWNNVTAGSAGGILSGAFSSMEISSSIISHNYAAGGGGILISSSSSLELSSCLISGNGVRTDGGGIYIIEESKPIITDCIVVDNVAESNGGGIAVGDVAVPHLSNVQSSGNSARYKGGGIFIDGAAGAILKNCTLSYNSAFRGGGFYGNEQAEYSLTESLVSDNSAHAGGGVYALCSHSVISDVSIWDNTANYGGGVIALPCLLADHTLELELLDIAGNSADEGGGVYIESILNQPPFTLPPGSDDYTFENCTIRNNTATVGGGIYHAPTQAVLLTFGPECTLKGNLAESIGGAVFLGGSDIPPSESILLYNAVFEDNVAYFAGSTIAFDYMPTDASSLKLDVMCANCTFGSGNISGVNNTAGYQTAEGMATLPSDIELVSACPGDVTLIDNAFAVTMDMWDGFGTKVQGALLAGGDYTAAATSYWNEDAPCAVSNNETRPMPVNGTLTFPDLTLEGTDGNTCQVTFYTPGSGLIAAKSCSIVTAGCPSGGEVAAAEQSEFDTCVEDSALLSTGWIIFISIASVLCCVLVLLLLILAAVYMRRRREPEYHNMGALPDFHEKSLTLEEVMNDPNIAHIAWEYIQLGQRIGIGGSGIVWQATMRTGSQVREVALKQLLFGVDNIQESILQEFLREIRLMNELHHENVVAFLGIAISDQRELYLITELMENGSFFDLLTKKQQNMPWHLRLKLLKDAAHGMSYLHSRNLIHRDLKSQNLLVSDKWECKIADFGISTIKPEASRAMTCIGTPMYMAPEVITKNKYSEKADIFSFGILLVEAHTCRPPYSEPKFARVNQAQLMYQIANEGLRPSVDGLPPGLEQLVQDCWNEEPSLRPSFKEIGDRLERLRTQSLDDERLEIKVTSPRMATASAADLSTASARAKPKPKPDHSYVSFDSHEIQTLINSEDFGPITSSAALGSIKPKRGPGVRASVNLGSLKSLKGLAPKRKKKKKKPAEETPDSGQPEEQRSLLDSTDAL